jgi:hypothetical protein
MRPVSNPVSLSLPVMLGASVSEALHSVLQYPGVNFLIGSLISLLALELRLRAARRERELLELEAAPAAELDELAPLKAKLRPARATVVPPPPDDTEPRDA